MIFLLRSLSRSRSTSLVAHDEESRGAEDRGKVGEDDEGRPCTSLTVWRKSLLFSCSGFTVIDCKGSLAYRVDNYIGRPGEIVLMDGDGKSILTVRRRKNLRLVDEWLIFEGEASNDHLESLTRRSSASASASSASSSSSSSSTNKQIQQKQQPAYYVKKLLNILQANSNNNDTSNVLAHVYLVGSKAGDHEHHHNNHQHSCKRSPAYVIEGSYSRRSCKVLDCNYDSSSNKSSSSRKMVAEIKRKEAINGCASFGLEVFHLIVWPGFDPALAMTLVLLLDQMFT